MLDPEQNSAFQDHYIDLPFDLSHVLFVTTANDASAIPGPLYDRMDVITLGSYTAEEKFHIASKYLVPKQLKKHGIKAAQLRFTPKALHAIIEDYTREAGVRTLERTGVSAVIIEDKTGLKKNSLFGTEVEQTQDTIENFCAKIAAGKAAQKTREFMIIARVKA